MNEVKSRSLKIISYIFLFLTICLAVFLPSVHTVKADNIKNKTFYIHSEHPLAFQIQAIKDTDTNVTNLLYYWPVGGTITISDYDKTRQLYTVTMKDVNVTEWTPYLEFRAPAGEGYYPVSISDIRDDNNNGMNYGTHQVHNQGDISDKPDKRLMYIGLGYTVDEIKVNFQDCTYNVKYNISKGKGDSSTTKNIKYNTATTLHKAPTRYGYDFAGWYCTYDGKTYGAGSSYNCGKYSISNFAPYGPEITMKDTWTPKKYNITYNSNKPSGASGNVTGSTATQTLKYEQADKLRNNGYSLTGWTFVNWNTKADGSGQAYNAGQSVTTVNDGKDTTLYAQWKPNVYGLHLNNMNAVTYGTTDIYEKYDHGWYAEK